MISKFLAQDLLPYFAAVLNDVQHKKFYELNDGVIFLADCLQYGSEDLFNQLKGNSA
jgi:hypothetical protein